MQLCATELGIFEHQLTTHGHLITTVRIPECYSSYKIQVVVLLKAGSLQPRLQFCLHFTSLPIK